MSMYLVLNRLLNNKICHAVVLTTIASAWSTVSLSQEQDNSLVDSSIPLHGFISQGFVNTTDNKFFGDSDTGLGSFEYTELGLNTSINIHPLFNASGQLLFRRAGKMYENELSIDYAFIDFIPVNSESGSFGILAGRFKNPLGLYNDTRDVAFTRPGNFLPQTVYFDKVRNLLLSNDGLQIHSDLYFGSDHHLDLQMGAGMLPVDDNVKAAYLGPGLDGFVETNKPTVVGRALYNWNEGVVKLSISGAKGEFDFKQAPTDHLFDGNVEFFHWVASAQYNAESWSVTAEYMEQPVTWNGLIPFYLDGREATLQGYYVQGDYRFNTNWQTYLRYEEGYADKNDKNGQIASALWGDPTYDFYTKLWTIGTRWDPSVNWMLRAEYSRANGTFILSPVENPDTSQLGQYWDMFSITASYRF